MRLPIYDVAHICVTTFQALHDSVFRGMVTKREFLVGGNQALPNFEGVEGLGHHYNPEGEYWLHHEEIYHNTPETQISLTRHTIIAGRPS